MTKNNMFGTLFLRYANKRPAQVYTNLPALHKNWDHLDYEGRSVLILIFTRVHAMYGGGLDKFIVKLIS